MPSTMNRQKQQRRQCIQCTLRTQGMTLIELLVAVALLAIVASLAYRGLDSLARSSSTLTTDSQRWQDLALFFNRFGNDVAQPVRRPIHLGAVSVSGSGTAAATANNATGGSLNQRLVARYSAALSAMSARADYSNAPGAPAWHARPLATLDAQDGSALAALEFTRKSATGRDEIRLGYRLRGSQIELLLWPALDRENETTPRPTIHPLLDGVSALHFQHLNDNNQWLDHWPPEGAADDMLPRAVAIELTLQNGTRLRRVFALPS